LCVSSSTARNCGFRNSRFENGIVVRARRTSYEEEEGSDLHGNVSVRNDFVQNEADLFDTSARITVALVAVAVVVSSRRRSTTTV
jgi:hypothetical protein